ncbi:hypothetical protein D3C80_1729420 [compost metagenome]
MIPDAAIVAVIQAYPAELRRKRRTLAQHWLVFVIKHAAGIQSALEQFAAFTALELVTTVLAAGLIQGRKQAQDADILFPDEARGLVQKFIQ